MAGVLGRVFLTPCGIWNKETDYKDLSLVSVRMEKKIVAYVSDGDIPSGTEITDARWVPWFEIEDGKDGVDGRHGTDGNPGAKGDPGEKGNPFTYEDFTPEQLAALKVKGDTGKTGANGVDGADGENGITPSIGENGNWFIGSTDTKKPSRGANGSTGVTGAAGTNGTDGKDGTDGKSVTAIALTKNAEGVITGGTATLSDGSTVAITVTESAA